MKRAKQRMPMPFSDDPSPKTPSAELWMPPDPPPRDWGHAHAELEERLTRRLSIVEAKVGITRDPEPESPQADAQAPDATPPDPDRYRRALETLSVWTDPACWTLQGDAEEKRRTTSMLVQLHGYVLMALADQDVPSP